MTQKETFTNAYDAQTYFSSMKHQVCMETSSDLYGNYIIETKLPAELKNKILCCRISNAKETYGYTILTEDGTHQAGVGCIIVKHNGGLIGSVPILVKAHDKFILSRRIDHLNMNNFTPFNNIQNKDILQSFDEETRPYVEEANPDQHLQVWSANGWVKILKILRYPLFMDRHVFRIWRIETTKGILDVDSMRQSFIIKPKHKTNSIDTTELIRSVNEIRKQSKSEQQVSNEFLLYKFPDNRIFHKNSNTYNPIKEFQRAFYAKFQD